MARLLTRMGRDSPGKPRPLGETANAQFSFWHRHSCQVPGFQELPNHTGARRTDQLGWSFAGIVGVAMLLLLFCRRCARLSENLGQQRRATTNISSHGPRQFPRVLGIMIRQATHWHRLWSWTAAVLDSYRCGVARHVNWKSLALDRRPNSQASAASLTRCPIQPPQISSSVNTE
jgi:hypothetical protein